MKQLDHPPRAVVVGYGRWGEKCHCYLIGTTPGIELYGIVTGAEDKARQAQDQHGCAIYKSLDDALEDPAVDLVVLATPNSTHADLAVRALRAGKHVVTDKVMCLTLAECDRMMATAIDQDRLLTVFQNRRLDGDFQTVRSLIEDRELGDVRWIEMSWQGFGTWRRWRGEAAMGGGKLYDLGAHLVDQLLLLMPDRPLRVYCRTHFDNPEFDVETEGLIVVEFEAGRTGVIDVSSLAAIHKPRFYVRGDRATFSKHGLDPQEAAMLAGDIDVASESPDHFGTLKTGAGDECRVPTIPGRWRDYFENIRDVLVANAPPLVPLADMRGTMAVIDAAKRSMRTGIPVTVPQDTRL